MTGTDPDAGGPGKQRPLDSTQPFRPTDAKGTPPLPDNLPKIPGISLHYEIARGGMGVVYSGRQDFLDRRVAVKLLSVELGGEAFVQRFQREAKILAGVKHANIVACHLAGTTDDGQSYLVMEFIDGPSLKKWVSDHGPLSVPAALRMTRAIAQALAAAYQLGIIHRDVKPENILLETVTSTALDVAFPFTPKVVDLGLARASSGSASLGLTSPGSVMGTPATMSPEQYDEPDAVDFRTDIYGLGCVLFEMLVGHPAFRAKKLTDIVTLKRAPFAPNPCTENPEVPPAVGTLVQDMLATSRDDRPASYKELDERLEALLNAIAASARAAKTKPMVTDDAGATIVSKPNPAFPTSPSATKPPANVPPAKTSGPGLLRTAEINFLAEGLGDMPPGAPPASAFRDSGIAPPPGTVPPAATTAPAQPTSPLTVVSPPPPDANKRKWMMIGAAIGVVAVIGIGITLSSGGGNGGGGGGGGPDVPPKPPPGPVNARPVAKINGPERADLGKEFKLEVEATDAENDRLQYSWTVGGLVNARSATSEKSITLRFDDGLPDVPVEIECRVSDLQGEPVRASKRMVVGTCPVTRPLRGFKSTSDWQLDNASDPAWYEATGVDAFITCTARRTKRWATTALGDDSYWEWFGTLESEKFEEKSEYAKIGLRFEFGDSSWAVVAQRSEKPTGPGGKLEVSWFVEVNEAVRSGEDWNLRSLSPAVFTSFTEPDESVDDYRGWFSVQRHVDKLVLQVGESRTPPGGKEATKPGPSHTIPLPADASNGKLTLFVNQGIGRFRVGKR